MQFSDLTIEATLVKQGDTPEADTGSKNGRNLNSLMSSGNNHFFNKIKIITSTIIALIFLGSCSSTKDFTQIKGDVIGFHDNIKQTNYKKKRNNKPKPRAKPYFLVNEKGLNQVDHTNMKNYIAKLEPGLNTSLYYAVDRGLLRAKSVRKKHMQNSGKSKYYSVIFTDGLDNISNQLGKVKGNDGQWQLKYDKKIQKMMKKVPQKKTQEFNSFVIVYYGDDLKNSGWTQKEIATKLEKLSGKVTGKKHAQAPEVIVLDSEEQLEELAEKFKAEFTTQAFTFFIPKGYVGRKIKMELKDDLNNTVSFTGDFIKKGKQYLLKNIVCSNGFSFTDIYGNNRFPLKMSDNNNKKDTKVYFDISSLKIGNKPFKYQYLSDSQYIYYENRSEPLNNSEYHPTKRQFTDAYILSIIDCSTSMGETEREKAKKGMNDIVEVITGQD